jgi:hypothetical protein
MSSGHCIIWRGEERRGEEACMEVKEENRRQEVMCVDGIVWCQRD